MMTTKQIDALIEREGLQLKAIYGRVNNRRVEMVKRNGKRFDMDDAAQRSAIFSRLRLRYGPTDALQCINLWGFSLDVGNECKVSIENSWTEDRARARKRPCYNHKFYREILTELCRKHLAQHPS